VRTVAERARVQVPAARSFAAGSFAPASLVAMVAVFGLAACEPRVRLEAPTEPITINLNINIQQEVRIKVERDLEQLFTSDSKLF
jgi:hypothetical protein